MADMMCVDCKTEPRGPQVKTAADAARCTECRRVRWRRLNTRRYRKAHPTSQGKIGWMKPGLEPVLKPTNLDVAWAAGIYEGEGSVYYADRSTRVQVWQKQSWILDRLRDLFGGKVDMRKGTHSPAGNPWVHCWRVSGPRSRGFLLTVYPFLSPRRQQKIREVLHLGVSDHR